MKLIKYPETEQFRHVVYSVNRNATFKGLDENNEPIYDELAEKPTIKFKGTVKLHGTNAGVCFNSIDGLYVQSRGTIYTLDDVTKHEGFVSFVKNHKEIFEKTVEHIKTVWGIDTSIYTISLYGEWAGKGIQKTVAISELPKSFYFFGIKVSKPIDPEFTSYWLDGSDIKFESDLIRNINEFETFEMDIDFNNPSLAYNKFIELIDYVEKECPVAKQLGVSGVGEGIVWKGEYKGNHLMFKIKGEKHAGKSKVKTIKPIDEGKLSIVSEVVDKVTPIWRLNQMFNEATNNGTDIDRKYLGTYIKMVLTDIMKEDYDIIIDAGLEPKDINGGVSKIARNYFFEQEQF